MALPDGTRPPTLDAPARVAQLVDAEGLNPSVPQGTCGFDSRPGHQCLQGFAALWTVVAGPLRRAETLTAIQHELVLDTTKTPKSRRRISLDPDTVAALRRHRAR